MEEALKSQDHAHAPAEGFLRKYVFSLDHKVIGKQYYALALAAVFIGMVLSWLMRFHLVWPNAKIPGLELIAKTGAPGGIITPGLGLSADALFSRAARLYRVDIKRPAKVIGTNTVAHLQSGIYFGYIGLVDGIIERILAELGAAPDRPPRIVASGGLAHLIAPDSRYIQEIDDLLTLRGLRLIYESTQTV